MAKREHDDSLIEEIHEIRRRISARFGNDPVRLGKYYMERQEQYSDRLIWRDDEAAEDDKSAA
jgi:hypothetical protein